MPAAALRVRTAAEVRRIAAARLCARSHGRPIAVARGAVRRSRGLVTIALVVACARGSPGEAAATPVATGGEREERPSASSSPERDEATRHDLPAAAAGESAPDDERVELHSLSFATEDCSTSTSSVLGGVVLAAGPWFAPLGDDTLTWAGPTRCALFAPAPVTLGRGALFVDVDRDGRDEAVVLVVYERDAYHGGVPGGSLDIRRECRVLLVRSTVGGPETSALVGEDSGGAPTTAWLSEIGGARVEEGRIVVSGISECWDCGCEGVELTLSCRASACVLWSTRITDPVVECDSP